MKLFPRGLASLTLAVAAVPAVAPLTGPAPGSGPGHVPTVGGWTRQDPDSPDVRQAATFAVVNLSEVFGHHYVVEHVKRAESQVVEGVNYRLTVHIAEVRDEILGTRKDCTVVVWSRPWHKPADLLTSFDCQTVDTDLAARIE